jgi:small GTP-binding protein
MLGASAVGKSSLVRQYVHGIFDEQYKTTIGVRIEGMDVPANGQLVKLLISDLEGYDDPLQQFREIQIPGAEGYVLVVDGTRPETLDIAKKIQQQAETLFQGKPVPFVALLNKRDLTEEWRLSSEISNELAQAGWKVYETSAKAGKNVENVPKAFQALVRQMLQVDRFKSECGGETLSIKS